MIISFTFWNQRHLGPIGRRAQCRLRRCAQRLWLRQQRTGAALLERVFGLERNGTSVRTEIAPGATTFLTMAYIVAVNPAVLGQAGMPAAGVAVATCLAAGIGSLLMGLLANYPLALAPGMGLNAYFTFTVVKGMGLPWQTALGCVFISGLMFLALTLAGAPRMNLRGAHGHVAIHPLRAQA
jgi:xanthine/uracil/vitamin C permease (AzgA family)